MSEVVNIQLELEAILKTIEEKYGNLITVLIKKLLMADYEIFTVMDQMAKQIAEQGQLIKSLYAQMNETGETKKDADKS